MEGMLARLRELEGEKQQLEARQALYQEENIGLGRQVDELAGKAEDLEGLETQLADMIRANEETRVSKSPFSHVGVSRVRCVCGSSVQLSHGTALTPVCPTLNQPMHLPGPA